MCWINGFPPSKSGNYLTVHVKEDVSPTSEYVFHYRYDYNSENGYWYNDQKYPVYKDELLRNRTDTTIFWWWDEYGITKEKTVIKLKF